MKKLPLIILVIIAVIAFLLIFWQYLSVIDYQPAVQSLRQPVGPGSSETPKRVKETPDRDKIIFKEVGDVRGYAEGRVSFDNGEFILVVEADLPEPAARSFYAGWLIQETPFAYIKLGEMRKNPDGLFALSYTSAQDLRTHKKVVISLEKTRDDRPDQHIFSGSY